VRQKQSGCDPAGGSPAQENSFSDHVIRPLIGASVLPAICGVNAISGGSPGQTVIVDIMRTTLANNAGAGAEAIQVAGLAIVAIGSSQLQMNGTATNSALGGGLLTYGTNQLLGPLGTGFTGTRSPL
jgi:hypothetical protein